MDTQEAAKAATLKSLRDKYNKAFNEYWDFMRINLTQEELLLELKTNITREVD